MLDSGAYSAWSKGETISLRSYIWYIKRHREHFEHYVNLDVIPGSPGKRATADMVERSAKLSYDNLQEMKRAGLDPIPVYHMGESMYWLKLLMKDGHGYIGISPATDAHTSEIIRWLDKVFLEITDASGRAKIKTHGFGIASFEIMKRYPWYSCDTVVWALRAAFGAIYVPIYKNGKPDYSAIPECIVLSNSDRMNVATDHISNFGKLTHERVRHFIERECGLNYNDVCIHWRGRAQAVCFFLQRFQKAIGDVRFDRRVQRGLL